ncbi:MAG: Kelch repeat type 2-containing protein [Chitinophagaceae bacterium]|nr:Kelch repeat type 2-containing protein [Chitinophagaceae bacterium]
MRKALLLFSICCLCMYAMAQTGAQWTWVNGGSSNAQTGTYGTMGTPSSANKPGSRLGAVSWSDAAGNLWLFGGLGQATTGLNGLLNDIWKYNPFTNQWTWVNGNNTINGFGIYGVQGTPASGNSPGARIHATTWKDAAGNFWLFGGEGYGASTGGTGNFLNDLWKFDPTTSQWTWVNGDITVNSASVYGTLGVTLGTNKPGGRHHSIAWVDAAGSVWLFGGHQSGSNTLDRLNDLWKYDPVGNQWTWVNGDNTVDQSGIYGTIGVAAISNKPGAREETVGWVDASGNFWLFGGEGRDEASGALGYLDDLWMLDPTGNAGAGIWTWVNGDKVRNQVSVYGTVGVENATNKPGGRFKPVLWKEPGGEIGILGGFGFASSAPTGFLNDVWRYNPTNNQWTFQKGDNTINNWGVYGSLGSPAASNKPGARRTAVSWIDASGNFWLFGGDGYDAGTVGPGRLNDLWTISFLVLPVKYESFTATKSNETVLLKWVTLQEFSSSRFEIEHSTDGIHYSRIAVVAAAGNSTDRTSYEYIHSTPAPGANYYRLKQIDIDDKFEYSEVRKVNFEGGSALTVSVLGNPFQSGLSFSVSSFKNDNAVLQLNDVTGRSIWTKTATLQKGTTYFSIDGSRFSSGVYILSVNLQSGIKKTFKVVKQ